MQEKVTNKDEVNLIQTATKKFDSTKLSSKEMLFNDKEQQSAEQGFRFLKILLMCSECG